MSERIENHMPQQLPNPCVRHCCLDDKDICLGCFRSLDEILNWRKLTIEQQNSAIIEMDKRRLAHTR